MDTNEKCRIAELKFFHDHLRKSFVILKSENMKLQMDLNSDIHHKIDFSIVKENFEELALLCTDLGDKFFANHFYSFIHLIDSCHNRTTRNCQKKMVLMSQDYEVLIGHLIGCYQRPSKLEDLMRAFEVQSFKQERLLKNLETGEVPADRIKTIDLSKR